MTFNRWVFLGMLWAVFVFLGAFTQMNAVDAEATSNLDALFNISFIDFGSVNIGTPSNPLEYIVAGGKLIALGGQAFISVFNLATFNTGVFVGDWQWVRFFFFTILGMAFIMTYGLEVAKLLFDAAKSIVPW